VVPVKNVKPPLMPADPALNVCTTTLPLDFVDPSPVVRLIEPPVSSSSCPALTRTWPPVEAVPAPTESRMSPPFPAVAAPVEIITEPDDPLLVVPDANRMMPLAPAAPALLVRIITPPLDFVVPSPEVIDIIPPV
jgi:hypothetical protein